MVSVLDIASVPSALCTVSLAFASTSPGLTIARPVYQMSLEATCPKIREFLKSDTNGRAVE
jgi:hypothetical protein